VHGARPQIEAELKAKGVRSRYAQGLRITDDAALMAVKQAAGVLRVELEALLSQGCRARRWPGRRSACLGNFITARPIGVLNGTDFQYTGAVRKVDAPAIARLGRRRGGGWCRTSATRRPARSSTFPGKTWPRTWPWRSRPTKLLMYTDRLPADRREGSGERAYRQGSADAPRKK